MVFSEESHADKFLDYLNRQHPSISFTAEKQNDHSLAFLDLLVTYSSGSLVCDIYRKPTFTGLGTSYFSNCCQKFKLNAVSTLVHRAYHLTSNFTLFHTEVNFLKNFFTINGYPLTVFENMVLNFLDKKHSPSPTMLTVPKQQFFFAVPYYNNFSSSQINKLVLTLANFYPHVDFKPSLSNHFTTGSLFRFKDKLPSELLSGLVYKYHCESCNASYVGCTRQRFRARICQHLGISDRTYKPLSSPTFSEPRNLASTCKSAINHNSFKIIASFPSKLLTFESLFIKQLKPSLNSQSSSVKLHIV